MVISWLWDLIIGDEKESKKLNSECYGFDLPSRFLLSFALNGYCLKTKKVCMS